MTALRTIALVLVAAAMLGAEGAREIEPIRDFESDFDSPFELSDLFALAFEEP